MCVECAAAGIAGVGFIRHYWQSHIKRWLINFKDFCFRPYIGK